MRFRRRDEVILVLENLKKLIQEADVFRELTIVKGSSDVELKYRHAFATYANFQSSFNKLGNVEREFLAAIGLNGLAEPDFWTSLASGSDDLRGRLTSIASKAEVLPALIGEVEKLLSRRSDRLDFTYDDEQGAPQEAIRLKLFIRETEDPSLTIRDLSSILAAIEDLFDSIAVVYELPRNELVIGALDSGSDKELDLLGISKAIKIVSELFIEVWDRWRPTPTVKASRNFKATMEGLSVLTKLSSLEKSEAISTEQAEMLKHKILGSVSALLSNGVYTEDMQLELSRAPLALPFERQRLLTHQPADPET